MSKIFSRSVSLLLVLSFITSQVFAVQIPSNSSIDTLSAPNVSSGISPESSAATMGAVARVMDVDGEGQIGNGAPVVALLRGVLPTRIDLSDTDLRGKVENAVRLAVYRVTVVLGGIRVREDIKIPEADKTRYISKLKVAKRKLIDLQENLRKHLYLFNAIVESKEDYLVGFNYGNYLGLSVELVESLDDNLLEQYIFHEAIPEEIKISPDGQIDRSDHRATIELLQAPEFGQDHVDALKNIIRVLIDAKFHTVEGKRIYFFGTDKNGNDLTEGDGSMKYILGGKGAGLAKLVKLLKKLNVGVRVPPGFTITTDQCRQYFKQDEQYPAGLQKDVDEYLARLEAVHGKKLGDPDDPLILSVRSGAEESMPGMMDTVLNLGLNDDTVKGLARKTNNEKFAYDCYRRFIAMFGNIVLGMKNPDTNVDKFANIMEAMKKKKGYKEDADLTVSDLQDLIREYKKLIKEETGADLEQNAHKQLRMAIEAVFRSSFGPRVKIYRASEGISDNVVSAVNVQVMVFGNKGDTSGTAVAFSRDMSTGEKRFNGEYLVNGQGEEVVAGIRKGMKLEEMKNLSPAMAANYDKLKIIVEELERIDKDAQDVEFTVEDGQLYMLQQRRAKRTAAAMLRIAMQFYREGEIDKEEALMRVNSGRFEELMHPMVDRDDAKKATKLAKGTAASPGAAIGRVVFTSKEAEAWKARGEKVILVREETSPEDVGGMLASVGILTSKGGTTSHAALVARQKGKPAVVGVGELEIDYKNKQFKIADTDIIVKEGDWITIDGTSGNVYLGKVKEKPSEIEQVKKGLLKPEQSRIYQLYEEVLGSADEIRQTEVWANADTPKDAEEAKKEGGEGIGLCRTEHMFFGPQRLLAVQTMLLAKEGSPERNAILEQMGEMQRGDFEGILAAMDGMPVTIRLLDPPIHEFLPSIDDTNVDDAERIEKIANNLGISTEEVKRRIEATREINPMLGTRGVRVAILNPSILKLQVSAMVEAYASLVKRGLHPKLKIMVPNVAVLEEFVEVKPIIENIRDEILDREGIKGADRKIEVGAMIEMPSACTGAEALAKISEFFSLGTNDLTQFGLAMSRDDAAKSFLQPYIDKGIFPAVPTDVLHPQILRLVEMAVNNARKGRPDIQIGVCGEHGGEPKSIIMFINAGLDYVSCSVPRLAVARLASAQAAILAKRLGRKPKAVTSPEEQLNIDIPINAARFAANAADVSARVSTEAQAKQTANEFVVAIDKDIGGDIQKSQLQTLSLAIANMKNLRNDKGELIFPNLRVIRESGADLVDEINKIEGLDLGNVFVVARDSNLKGGVFDQLKGKAMIATIDDSGASSDTYLPIVEALTLNMMKFLGSDAEAILDLYNKISNKPINMEALQKMLVERLISIGPKIIKFDSEERRKAYDRMAAEILAKA